MVKLIRKERTLVPLTNRPPPKLLILLGTFTCALIAVSVVGGLTVLIRTSPEDGFASLHERHAYDAVSWEIKHLPNKTLHKVSDLFGEERLDQEGETQVLKHYFQLNAKVASLERDLGSLPRQVLMQELQNVRAERREIENQVEDIMEDRIAAHLEELSLTVSPPLFSDIDLVFPLILFEFDSPPYVLATSPRDQIELKGVYLLTGSINSEDLLGIEREAELLAGTELSTILVSTGGIATYPSTILERSSQSSTVETIIHEWIHHYLALHPLGQSYFASDDLRTLNETVADLAAAELADVLLTQAKWSGNRTSTDNKDYFDFLNDMRELRVEVELLLRENRINEAEQIMEEQRLLFADKGYHIRTLNQAYFAYYDAYANSPASINPIGGKVLSIREKVDSIGEFIRLTAGFSTIDDLDRALLELDCASRRNSNTLEQTRDPLSRRLGRGPVSPTYQTADRTSEPPPREQGQGREGGTA